MSQEPWTFLLAVEKPALIPVVDDALREAGIPCRTGLQVEPTPMVVFTVPESRVELARPIVDVALRRHRSRRGATPPRPADDEGEASGETDTDATVPEPV